MVTSLPTPAAGIGPNMMLAKMATSKAKPNGQVRIVANDAAAFLMPLPVDNLPGVGWAMRARLEDLHLHTVADIRGRTAGWLQ